jgi:hypothetical protein
LQSLFDSDANWIIMHRMPLMSGISHGLSHQAAFQNGTVCQGVLQMDRTVLPTDNPAEQALDEYTVRVTFRLAAVFIINNGLAGLIAQFVSIHDTHIRLRNMGVIGLALLVFFGVLLLVQTRIHSSYWQKTIYFTITFLSYVLAHLINGDKGLLVAMAMVGLIMPFLVVLFRIRYALEFGALHLVAILVHWFIRPTATVAFGPARICICSFPHWPCSISLMRASVVPSIRGQVARPAAAGRNPQCRTRGAQRGVSGFRGNPAGPVR